MGSCADEEKVRVVRVVAKKIEKLSTHLVDCANIMARTHQDEEEDEEKQTSLKLQEDAELLRREWSSQVSHPNRSFVNLRRWDTWGGGYLGWRA